MSKVYSGVPVNLIISDNVDKITDDNLDNGDLIFCTEDMSLSLKYNDMLYKFISASSNEPKILDGGVVIAPSINEE